MKLLWIVILFPTVALADTGADLARRCRAAQEILDTSKTTRPVDASLCMAYLTGFVDASIIYTNSPKMKFCAPTLSTEQMVRIVNKRLAESPDDLNQPDYVVVFAAFHYAFPCDNQRGAKK